MCNILHKRIQQIISLLIMFDDKSESLEDKNLESVLLLNQNFAIRKRLKSHFTFYCWNCQPLSVPFTTMKLLTFQ